VHELYGSELGMNWGIWGVSSGQNLIPIFLINVCLIHRVRGGS